MLASDDCVREKPRGRAEWDLIENEQFRIFQQDSGISIRIVGGVIINVHINESFSFIFHTLNVNVVKQE